ncbi:hypothetical protein GCM10011519_15450 [Marmoricola endophyticus]|uniref:Uncharacterized protein n=1 Tax=Marmoricola endophyticus TaxID=2040280 RepID=A0A917BIA4_9ACTN|nr:hypothetical protein GCM10011519_15450 [Marmoricola endophyticus]
MHVLEPEVSVIAMLALAAVFVLFVMVAVRPEREAPIEAAIAIVPTTPAASAGQASRRRRPGVEVWRACLVTSVCLSVARVGG